MMLMLKIPTIRSPECGDFITKKLLHFRGVDHLIVDTSSKTLRLIYDKNRTTPTAIVNCLREIGHSAE